MSTTPPLYPAAANDTSRPASARRARRLSLGAGRWPWRLGGALLDRYLRRLERGRLEVQLADGTVRRYGGRVPGPEATLRVHRPRFFTRTFLGGDVGFGEAYVDGDWTSDDLPALLELLARNRDQLDDLSPATAALRRWLDRRWHARHDNDLAGNRRNIQDHYDLGNDFFELFLDPSMTYSCALFDGPDDRLEAAQERKLDTILDRAGVRPGERLLEIGSGWGSLALRAARQRGCQVTTITLSERQRDGVVARAREAGLEDRIEVRLQDYREVEGRFDRIVSIEMLEAVGHERLGEWFATCQRLLRPGGRVALQVITIRDDLYDAYRQGCDFIRRHIFPGGHLPSLGALSGALTASSSLELRRLDNVGPQYATTLRHWRSRLTRRADEARRRGYDDRLLRKWDYYFGYCVAGFESGMLADLQIVLDAPRNPATSENRP